MTPGGRKCLRCRASIDHLATQARHCREAENPSCFRARATERQQKLRRRREVRILTRAETAYLRRDRDEGWFDRTTFKLPDFGAHNSDWDRQNMAHIKRCLKGGDDVKARRALAARYRFHKKRQTATLVEEDLATWKRLRENLT